MICRTELNLDIIIHSFLFLAPKQGTPDSKIDSFSNSKIDLEITAQIFSTCKVHLEISTTDQLP